MKRVPGETKALVTTLNSQYDKVLVEGLLWSFLSFVDAISRNFNPLAHLNSLHLRIRFNFNVFMFLAGSPQPLIWPFIIPIPGSLKLVSPSPYATYHHQITISRLPKSRPMLLLYFWSKNQKLRGFQEALKAVSPKSIISWLLFGQISLKFRPWTVVINDFSVAWTTYWLNKREK